MLYITVLRSVISFWKLLLHGNTIINYKVILSAIFLFFSYSVGDGDSFLQKHMFNMALLLCVYYEYYCQNVT